MSTLLEIRTLNGLVGRCDARCYDAKHAKCHCICEGFNHGAGKEKAMIITRRHVETWILAFKANKGFRISGDVVEPSLPLS